MPKRKRYLGDLELHEAPHIFIRHLIADDKDVAGESCQRGTLRHSLLGQNVAMVLKSAAAKVIRLPDAESIPVTYDPERAQQNPNVDMVAYGRWHVNTDLDGVKFKLLNSDQQAMTKLYWTRPVYVIMEGAVFQGTEKWYPHDGQGRPASLSVLEATEAYTKLRDGARRAVRETEQLIDEQRGVVRYHKPRVNHNGNGEKELQKDLAVLFAELSFHEWRFKKAESGLRWVKETWVEAEIAE